MIYGVMVFITHIDKFFHNSPGKPDAGALLIFMKEFFNFLFCAIHRKRNPVQQDSPLRRERGISVKRRASFPPQCVFLHRIRAISEFLNFQNRNEKRNSSLRCHSFFRFYSLFLSFACFLFQTCLRCRIVSCQCVLI